MRQLLFCFAAILVASDIAAADAVCVHTVIDVTAVPGQSFACGSLVFSNFDLTDATGNLTDTLDIVSVRIDSQGLVTMEANPNLAPGGSEDLSFTVAGTLSSLSLAVGGTSASVTERACSNSIAMSGNTADLCSNLAQSAFVAPLGQLTVQSADAMQQVIPGLYTNGPVRVFESISAGSGGLTSLAQGFGDPVPEPVTFVLLGSALAFLGIAGRRLRK